MKEQEKQFCVWKEKKSSHFVFFETSCNTGADNIDEDYKYCPYCGKEIKFND